MTSEITFQRNSIVIRRCHEGKALRRASRTPRTGKSNDATEIDGGAVPALPTGEVGYRLGLPWRGWGHAPLRRAALFLPRVSTPGPRLEARQTVTAGVLATTA